MVKAAAERWRTAIQTHKMMLSILLAKQACENDATHEADRGSDGGDCTIPDGMRFAWAEDEPELPFEVDHLIDQ